MENKIIIKLLEATTNNQDIIVELSKTVKSIKYDVKEMKEDIARIKQEIIELKQDITNK